MISADVGFIDRIRKNNASTRSQKHSPKKSILHAASRTALKKNLRTSTTIPFTFHTACTRDLYQPCFVPVKCCPFPVPRAKLTTRELSHQSSAELHMHRWNALSLRPPHATLPHIKHISFHYSATGRAREREKKKRESRHCCLKGTSYLLFCCTYVFNYAPALRTPSVFLPSNATGKGNDGLERFKVQAELAFFLDSSRAFISVFNTNVGIDWGFNSVVIKIRTINKDVFQNGARA